MTSNPSRALEIRRRDTRRIHVGDVPVGGHAPVAVQSMTNTCTSDVDATVAQIHRLVDAGCEIIRVAVPDADATAAIGRIRPQVPIPIIADIHFDHRLAVASVRAGAHGLRINPGNIGSLKKVRAVVDCAREHGVSIRIGVNAGSLEKDLRDAHGGVTSQAMVASAMRHIDHIRGLDFHELKVSIKASDVPKTVESYRLLSEKTDLPLHVGVTEAGGLFAGITKSAVGIGMLLAEGIGDTIRVSLTRDPVEEIRVGYEILRALDIRRRGPEIISCPTCGRCQINLFHIAEQVEAVLANSKAPIKIAIMGCMVNGPGEAREADIGIAGGDGTGILFKKGSVVRKFPQEELVDVLLEAIAEFEPTA